MVDLTLRKQKTDVGSLSTYSYYRISLKSTHFMSISNNVIYNTYRSALTIISGRNNIIDSNLVTTVYWSGTAQPRSVAEKNTDYDAAITTDKTTSVVMTVCINL